MLFLSAAAKVCNHLAPLIEMLAEPQLGAVPRSETVDGDDQVVYTWSLPDEKDKRGESTDGDDKVVYTWSLPDEKKKRSESGDGDDQVVYTWSLPEE